jgi:lysosomal alpha-mannosidase
MYGGYCSPNGYLFEFGDDPITADQLLEDYNLVAKADNLVAYIKQQANAVRHNDIMISWGCDSMYQNAHLMFKNIEILMDYINSQPKYNVSMFYSTPSLYVDAINKQNVQWPTKNDDFFPYADGPHAYWTGYFTSRPTIKGYVRSTNNLLQATTQLYSLSGLNDASLRAEIFNLQEPMGVLQHHDAVAGTEKQHVADDYAKRLWVGSGYALDVISKTISHNIGAKSPVAFTYCPLLNESICPATDDLSSKKVISVVAYNPLGWTRVEYITLPVPVAAASVLDSNGKIVPSQISKGSPYTITFVVSIPPLGFATYFVQPGASNNKQQAEYAETIAVADPITLNNKFLTLNLDAQGNFVSATNKVSGKTVKIQQNYLYYQSSTGTPSDGQASGAYIFRPANDTANTFGGASPVVTYTNGTLMSEVRRVFSPYLTQIIRLYSDQANIEVVDMVGPIDTSDNIGKEVITRYTTDLATQDLFYTDSNGIEFQTRKINYRPSWPYQVVEPVSGNYYPINSAAYIKDSAKDAQFTLLTDRSRGGGSAVAGVLEAMIQRATVKDDSRGVGEPINEHNVVHSVSWLVVDAASSSANIYRQASKRLSHPLVLSFASTDSVASWTSQYKTNFAPLTKPLPPNVQLLTFAPTEQDSQYILRFHHTFQVGEDPALSQPVTIDINSFFQNYQVSSATETQLTAVRKSDRSDAVEFKGTTRAPINIVLKPTEIRTFVVTLTQMNIHKSSVNIVV